MKAFGVFEGGGVRGYAHITDTTITLCAAIRQAQRKNAIW